MRLLVGTHLLVPSLENQTRACAQRGCRRRPRSDTSGGGRPDRRAGTSERAADSRGRCAEVARHLRVARRASRAPAPRHDRGDRVGAARPWPNGSGRRSLAGDVRMAKAPASCRSARAAARPAAISDSHHPSMREIIHHTSTKRLRREIRGRPVVELGAHRSPQRQLPHQCGADCFAGHCRAWKAPAECGRRPPILQKQAMCGRPCSCS